jgi:hypothetical protein
LQLKATRRSLWQSWHPQEAVVQDAALEEIVELALHVVRQ